MKLLFVGTDRKRGGAQTHFVALARALAVAGHDVEAVVRPDTMLATHFDQQGIPCSYGCFHNVLDPRGYVPAMRHIRRFKPDWLVGNFGKEYWPLVVLSRLTRTKLALFRHTNRSSNRFTRRWIPRLADRFFVVSQFARKAQIAAGAPAEHIRISYNPLHTATYAHDAAAQRRVRQHYGVPMDAPLMGYVGLMAPGKAVRELMHIACRAMQQNDTLHVLWIGEGECLASIKAYAQQQSLAHRHHFAGWVDDVAACYSAFSFLAFPSRMKETFGRVAIEAQAAGIPVIANRVGGVPETLLDGETGWLLAHDDDAAWEQAILDLCDAQRCARMGARGTQFVREHFSDQHVARDFVAQLEAP